MTTLSIRPFRLAECLRWMRRELGRIAILTIALLFLMPAFGATRQAAQAADKKASEKKTQKDGDDAPPEPKEVPRTTRDGLAMKMTYYPSNNGKDAVPVVILHEWKGDRSQYKDLALYLQSRGCAVVVPDLRGHGGSTELQPPGQTKSITLSATRLRKADMTLMVNEDLEEVNRFLRDKNNEGELNIEKLCLVGVEMGATVAANWAVLDWNWQPLPTGKKMGQDVKALVLISPEWATRGLILGSALKEPVFRNADKTSRLSVMVLVGAKDEKFLQTSEKIYNMLKPSHPEPPQKFIRQDKDLFFIKLETSLQRAKLVNEQEFKVNDYIAGFIAARLTDRSFPWEERVVP